MPIESEGRVIAGRYELVSRVGEGGASNVWLARDRVLKITVALKVLRRELSSRKPMLEQFQREAELSARMLSPNIVRVLACGVDPDGCAYIAYELLDGEDLGARLVRKGKIDFAETETIVVSIARALSRAHGMGVIHRDIKPANAFVTKDDDGRRIVKVLDFGVAALIKDNIASEELSGTLEYMAPEILLEGKAPEARSDLYSIAVLAYRCLAGHVPYSGEAIGQVMVALATTKPEKISKLLGLGKNGEELDEWFEKALARDPNDRFETARELAEAFHNAVKLAKAGQPAPQSSNAPPAPVETKDDVIILDAKPLKVPTPPRPAKPVPPPLPKRSLPKVPVPLPRQLKSPAREFAPKPVTPPPPPMAMRDLPPMRKPAPSFVFEPDLDEPNPPPPPASSRKQTARMDVVEVDATSRTKDDRRS